MSAYFLRYVSPPKPKKWVQEKAEVGNIALRNVTAKFEVRRFISKSFKDKLSKTNCLQKLFHSKKFDDEKSVFL